MKNETTTPTPTAAETKALFQARSIKMIEELKALIVDNCICIRDKNFRVTKINQHSIELKSALKAKYIAASSPNSTVVEGKEYGVYFLLRGSRIWEDFTIISCSTVKLHHA